MVTIDPSYFTGLGKTVIWWLVFLAVNYHLKTRVFGERYADMVIALIRWCGIAVAAIALSLGFALGMTGDQLWELVLALENMKRSAGARGLPA